MKNKTLGFTATFGLIPGYKHDNQTSVTLSHFGRLWQDKMMELYESTGILVGCVVHNSNTVYPMAFGCPQGGETTVTVTGHYNPAFFNKKKSKKQNKRILKDATIELCWRIKEELKQTTVSLTFYKIDHFEYLSSKG